MSRSTLAIDVGTHSLRAMVFDARGEALALASRPLGIHRGEGGRVEQDPAEMLAACREVLAEILGRRRELPVRTGLAVQRSSVLIWNRESSEALGPILSWQDTRAADRLVPLKQHEERIIAGTGLHLSPHYGASKLAWAHDELADRAPVADPEQLAMGPLAAWLLANLREDGLARVDHVNASRTLLFDLNERQWDPTLIREFGIPADALPDCRPTRHDYGRLRGYGIPITAMSGDQNAAVQAEGPLPPDCAALNLGTGAFLMLPTGREARRVPDLLAGILDSDDQGAEHLVEGTVNGAGAALSWAEERWGLEPIGPWLDLLEPDPEGPLFLNTVGGLGSPWWRHDLEPRFFDLDGLPLSPEATQALPGASVARAVAESITFLLRANLDRLRRAGFTIRELRVSGGLSRSERFCQGLADLCGLPLHLTEESEATARGIAWLAAGRPEGWARPARRRFEPGRPGTRYKTWLAMMDDLT
jgi:glycerol kinase